MVTSNKDTTRTVVTLSSCGTLALVSFEWYLLNFKKTNTMITHQLIFLQKGLHSLMNFTFISPYSQNFQQAVFHLDHRSLINE